MPGGEGSLHGSQGQQALVREVAAHSEAFLQAWWAHRLWQGGRLRTAVGASVEVIEPGWLNRGPGPDFTEARLHIDGREHWGDVEVHLREEDWWAHGHQDDPRYARVILHLVLQRGGRPALNPASGEPLPVLEAAPLLRPSLRELMDTPEDLLRRYEQLPGRCGLRAALEAPEAVERVVAHAAEARARIKAERILAAQEQGESDEQLLFRQLFRYLGYRPHAGLFEALARRFPIAGLAPLLTLPAEQARDAVLARWFGAAGLLPAAQAPPDDPATRAEFERQRALWHELSLQPLAHGVRRGGSRPWNAAERRLAGLFHHLYAVGGDGWLRGWLRILRELDALRDDPQLRPAAVEMLARAFHTPADEPWRHRVGFHQPPLRRAAQLVGRERVIVLMANAILPTFLAFARRDGDRELEKLLYRLYIILPPEGPNQRTRFMEQRLAPFHPQRRTLRTHQGLLQVHQDFCISFHEGCSRCRLPEMIGPGSPQTRRR